MTQSTLTKREQVWLAAWTSTANANDCKDTTRATHWADRCLAAFDERFSQPAHSEKS